MQNLASAFGLINVLKEHGFESRIAGGAVRDILLNQQPKDIDIATTATPEQIITVFFENYHVIPTGIQHGTITVVKNGVPYEITTLRIDKETDGRHAVVEFTDDWKLDASRRDFTINAMYMDENKTVYDFFGGREHLKTKTITFVGDPFKRIVEDYLRILRYFRFLARFDGQIILKDIEAIYHLVNGLDLISKERILSEISKTVMYKNVNVFHLMNMTQVSSHIFNKKLDVFNMKDFNEYDLILHSMGVKSDWFVEYKATSDTIKKIKFLENFVPSELNYDTFKYGEDRMKEYSILNRLNWNVPTNIPKFPVSGFDLLNLKGPMIGVKLEELQRKWALSNFTMSKEELLK